MLTRMLDRLESVLAVVGDQRRWFLLGLALPAAVAVWLFR